MTEAEKIWNKYKNSRLQLRRNENILATDPRIALLYAKTILQGRFQSAEETLKHSKYGPAYEEYLRSLENKSWITGLKIIKTCSHC